MDNIFGDMLGNSVYIYLDDIIIANKDTTSHMETFKVGAEAATRGRPKIEIN